MRWFNFSGQSITVAEALARDKNNFDLFRLIAALLVIYGHSFATVSEGNQPSLFYTMTGYWPQLVAVNFFFFLSGLLVTDSLLRSKSVSQFLIARFFRIWPGLAFVLVITAFIIGPLATSLSLVDYFNNPNTYLYIKHQLFMETWNLRGLGYFELPGVFSNNVYKGDVNVSLWTLAAESFAYLFLAAAYLCGVVNRRVALILITLIVVDSLLPSRILFTFLQGNEDYSFLPFCFAIGSLYAFYKDDIRITIYAPLGFFLFFLLLHGTVFQKPFFYLTCFTSVILLATREFVRKVKLPADVSYGVYLWGWPIQQCLAFWLPEITRLQHYLTAMLLAILIGFFSWTVVERPLIKLGKRLAIFLRNSPNGAEANHGY